MAKYNHRQGFHITGGTHVEPGDEAALDRVEQHLAAELHRPYAPICMNLAFGAPLSHR